MHDSDDSFPFRRVFNLLKLIDFWRESASSDSPAVAAHAKAVLAMLDSTPELTAEEIDPAALARHPDVLSVVMSPVIPLSGSGRSISGAVPPYSSEFFYATESFRRLRLLEDFESNVRISGANLTPEVVSTGQAVDAYLRILEHLYGISHDGGFPFIVTRIDEKSGLARHYKLEFDTRFVEIAVEGELKELAPAVIERLLSETMDLDLWRRTLPPEQFEFRGFAILNATDVTVQEELSLLKDDLLKPGSLTTSEQVDGLENRLRVILGRPALRLGLIGLERSEFGAMASARPIGRSLLISGSVVPHCPNKSRSFYAKAFESNDPVIVTCLDDCKNDCTGFETHLLSQGLRNLLVAPLMYEKERVGLLELASPNRGDINNWNAGKLLQVTQLFATALNRELRERDNEIQAVIKKHYTAIHPTIEWRFRESAIRYLERLEADGRADKEEIVFHDVYPLYGLSDIRGSSTHRVDAIRDDLRLQLRMARDILTAAAVEKALPVVDELRYQVDQQIGLVDRGLSSGDEISVLEFLSDEIESRLDHLSTFGGRVAEAVQAYRSALDPTLHMVYRGRKAYEESVALINDAVAAYLEREDDRAQEMYPHYFERYQTDGVDYNIYVGGSLVENGGFDPLYLKNLRLWQLMTTCGIAWELNDLKRTLPVSLDTAHLILVQSTPLAIRFREDEKRFDIDGAYNARYEIVKKRIDKAHVRGSNERLTLPGQIAIVYSQAREAVEYRRYLNYLLAVGYLEGNIEELEIEDTQGVSGLRALRVTVAPTSPDVKIEVTPEGEMRPVKASDRVTA